MGEERWRKNKGGNGEREREREEKQEPGLTGEIRKNKLGDAAFM
jgi:hypothetical protein